MPDVAYFAVPDPSDATRMTYWREAGGKRKPWPAKATYGPALYRTDLPDGLDWQARQDWIADWMRANAWPWYEQVNAAIEADRAGCARRFAEFTSRCCQCGRKLRDPATKVEGIGPECREDAPAWLMTAAASEVSRVHAARG